MRRFLITLITALNLAIPVLAQEITSLLPPLPKLENWRIIEKPKIYLGDDLFELINGGADVYLEYGFNQVVTVDYADPEQTIIQLEIYEMLDPASAFGIFSLSQQAAEWKLDFGRTSASSKDYIAFWKGKYYVIVSWESRHPDDAPQLPRIAAMVDGAIQDQGEFPTLVNDFRAMDPAKKTVYMKGNLALSNFYYFDYKDIFEIVEGIGCSPGSHHRIVFRYSDEARALSVLASAKQLMINGKRFTDIAMSYQGFTCTDNKSNRIMVRQVGRYIAVLVALNPSVSLTPLMDEVMQKIEGNP